MAYLPNGSQREVILKHIHPHLVGDPVLVSHLSGFSDVARGLLHPGLAPIWDVGEVTGETFFVREYLPGISLQRLFSLVQKNEAILSPSMAIYLTQEIVEAISAIHRFRVSGQQPIYLFHGGLSPENIILTRIGGVVLTDAGLDVIFWRNPDVAWRLRQRKMNYQPPEYGTGERPMRRGDGFGVAALLYQMVMGGLPHDLPDTTGQHSFTAPSSRHPRVTEHFDQFLFTCLHPNVEQRMVQMKEIQKALAQSHLLRQESMQQREAMAYLEALVSEAFPLEQENRTELIFDQPFELESILPIRNDLLPPERRYRQPIHDSTDSFHPNQSVSPEEHLHALSASVGTHASESSANPDNLSIGFDVLGPPLHESSELGGKTLATPPPEADEEDLHFSPHPGHAPEKTEVFDPEVDEVYLHPKTEYVPGANALDPFSALEPSSPSRPEGTTPGYSRPIDPETLLEPIASDEIDEHEISEEESTATSAHPMTDEQKESLLAPDVLDILDAPDEALSEEDLLIPLSEEDEEDVGEATFSASEKAVIASTPSADINAQTLEQQALASEEATPLKVDELLAGILDQSVQELAKTDALEEIEEAEQVPVLLSQDDLVSEEVLLPEDIADDDDEQELLEDKTQEGQPLDPALDEAAAGTHAMDESSANQSVENTSPSIADLPRIPPRVERPVEPDKMHSDTYLELAEQGQEQPLVTERELPAPQFQEQATSFDSLSSASSDLLTPLSVSHMPETVALPTEQVPGHPGSLPEAGLHVSPPPGMPETVVLAHEDVQQHPHLASNPSTVDPPLSTSGISPSPSPASVLLPGQEQFGKFILLNRVALGGMAEVFRAKFSGPGGFQKVVAIKRILPEYTRDHNFLQMFVDEARIAGSLRHPHIVQIQELGEIEGVFFISMEYIDGIDLARVIKIRRALQQPIPVELVIEIGICICRALDYAHNECDPDGRPLQMIHRDVTPHNILISKKGECKLTDFGIAKAAQNIAETAVGELKGKISYMSPEQAEGVQLDMRSDIFQVGIVLYEMLTLQKMFEGNSDQSILNKIQNAQFEPPRRIMTGVPKWMEQVILKALATDPNERYQTSAELQKALSECKGHVKTKKWMDISDFAHEILQQRDELLAQHAEARRQQVQQHAFSRMESPEQIAQRLNQPLTPQVGQRESIDIDSSEPEKKTSSKWWLPALGLLLLGIVGVAAFLLLENESPPPTVEFSIFTTPSGADVQLDGRFLTKTPVFGKRVPYDKKSHTLRIEKLGYKAYIVTFRYKHPGESKRFGALLIPYKQISPQVLQAQKKSKKGVKQKKKKK